MRSRIFGLLCFFLAALTCSGQSFALVMGARTDKVSADVFTSAAELNPQAGIDLLLRLQMHNGWHTYWSNPGDAGLPTGIKWSLPEGYEIETREQSLPQKFVVDGLVQYGYDQTAYWKFRLKPKGNPIKKYGAEDFQATVSWLACREECMPETVKISFSLPIVEQIPEIPQIWQDEVLKASNSFPVKTSWQSRYEIADGNLLIDLKTPNHNFAKDVQKITFIPFRQGLIVNNAPQKVGFDRSGNLSVSVPVDNDKAEDAGGVLVVEHENGRRGYLLAPEKASGLSEYEPINYETQTLPVIMLMAFLGGIILNFMPCIFPILSIKAIALVQGAYNRRSARIEALIYMVGVVSCFLLMATVLVWLREKGEHIGWGFQLQSPTFVVIMIVIFFIVFLMLLDLVNFRNPFANRVGRISFAKQKLNAFFTGFFAVLIASPCTAPFMGIAIGYTLAKPIYVYYPVFLSLSLGYALPFTLIGLFPDFLARLLPKPGRWMSILKKIFAIPVLLTCFWLMWVLGHLTTESADSRQSLDWQPYDERQVNELVRQNKPVFIDFTAKWCITCLANEKLALDTSRFAELVQKHHIHLFKADWTNKDRHIAEALERYGRNSIPLYVYYDSENEDYVILPQLLTPGILNEYLDGR